MTSDGAPVAIPLYVIVLAMLGAGINMTRQVPQIQADYDSNAGASLKGALSAPLAVLWMRGGALDDDHTGHSPSEIRMKLIQTHMYFLSAPFLAVAVYYLLQVIASSVAEPVLVVLSSFAGSFAASAADVAGGSRQIIFATLFGDLNGDGEVDVDELVESAHANGAHAPVPKPLNTLSRPITGV